LSSIDIEVCLSTSPKKPKLSVFSGGILKIYFAEKVNSFIILKWHLLCGKYAPNYPGLGRIYHMSITSVVKLLEPNNLKQLREVQLFSESVMTKTVSRLSHLVAVVLLINSWITL
jgi:hypothetical protein